MKISELRAELDFLGVPFEDDAKKKDLEALLESREHEVTAEDLKAEPGLKKEGIEIGDVIYLPVEEPEQEVVEEFGVNKIVSVEAVKTGHEDQTKVTYADGSIKYYTL